MEKSEISLKIELKGLKFYGFHGVKRQEKSLGNFLTIDVELTIEPKDELESDKLADAVNYENIYQIIAREVNKRSNLLENLSWRIAKSIYNYDTSRIKEISVRIQKSYYQGAIIHGMPAITLTYSPKKQK